MSTPHTLAEASRELKASRNSNVDILGIVKNLIISRQSTVFSRRQSSVSAVKCRIWFVDDSSSGSANDNFISSAQFIFYNTNDAVKLEQEQIKEGDLLRFNGVVLAKNSEETNPCFQFSAHAEPGQGWACLGKIDSTTRVFVPKRTVGTNMVRMLPGAMTTSPERIQELADWYSNHLKGRPLDAQKTAARNMTSPSKHLSSLPCRNRQLDELQASLGIFSNIKVAVTSIHSEPAKMVTTNIKTRSSKKRRIQQVVSALALATVTDETKTVMTLVDVSGRFVPQFTTAMANQSDSRLVVTNVLTKAQSSLQGIKVACPTNETVLVTTNETAVFLVPFDPNRILTQLSQGTGGISLHRPNNSSEKVVVSELLDLIIERVSLKESEVTNFSATSDYLHVILETGGDDAGYPAYKSSAKVLLDGESIESSFLSITPIVLKCLCGGLDSKDLIKNDSLCRHSMNFLCSLIHDKVQLKWIVREDETGGQGPLAVKAALHGLLGDVLPS